MRLTRRQAPLAGFRVAQGWALLLASMSPMALAQGLQPTLTVSSINGSKFQANQTITTSGSVTVNGSSPYPSVVFLAGTQITLLPGFQATAPAGSAGNTFTASIAPPDFVVSVTTTTPAVTPGSVATYTPTVTGIFNFSGMVALSTTGVPSTVTASMSSPSVTVPMNGSTPSTLTLTTSTTTAPNTYSFNVMGMASVQHTAGTALTVSSQPQVQNPISPQPAALREYIRLGGRVVAIENR